ncbi:MAG: hypothetical protein AABX88_01015, partial [Nanoarchaeota archaeon]
FFWYEFVKTLIKQSNSEEVKKFEKTLKLEVDEKIHEPQNLVKKIIPPQKIFGKPLGTIQKKFPEGQYEKSITRQTAINPSRPLQIPRPRLPPHIQHIRPTPTLMQIDVGQLNPLLDNPMTSSVECSGPNTRILVRTKTGINKTELILNEKEINDILEKFFSEAKIPFEEGVHEIVRGHLILSAIVSGTIGSKFIIKKMTLNPALTSPQFQRPPTQRFPR